VLLQPVNAAAIARPVNAVREIMLAPKMSITKQVVERFY
jgi:hypothetical protein